MKARPGQYLFAAGRGLTQQERDRAQADIDALRENLSGAATTEDTTIRNTVMMMFTVMDRGGAREEQLALAAGYLTALSGLPPAAIQTAITRFMQRKTKLSPAFVPKPPELVGIVEDVIADWRFAVNRLARLLNLEEAAPVAPEPPLSESDRAVLQERIRRFTTRAALPAIGVPVRSAGGTSPAARVLEETAGRRAARSERGGSL